VSISPDILESVLVAPDILERLLVTPEDSQAVQDRQLVKQQAVEVIRELIRTRLSSRQRRIVERSRRSRPSSASTSRSSASTCSECSATANRVAPGARNPICLSANLERR
jgi:hypothetical protein